MYQIRTINTYLLASFILRPCKLIVSFIKLKNKQKYLKHLWWSYFQVQGHIFGQVVTLYQICCTKTYQADVTDFSYIRFFSPCPEQVYACSVFSSNLSLSYSEHGHATVLLQCFRHPRIHFCNNLSCCDAIVCRGLFNLFPLFRINFASACKHIEFRYDFGKQRFKIQKVKMVIPKIHGVFTMRFICDASLLKLNIAG